MTAQTATLTDFLARIGGRQPCCGATNRVCARPPGVLRMTLTGCEHCGHVTGCHVKAWS